MGDWMETPIKIRLGRIGSMKKSLLGKGVATLAIMTAMPFMSTVQALADTSNNSFTSQYQANETKEASLLQTAKSSSFSDSYTQVLSSSVQNINSEVTTLYNAEQALAAQRSQTVQREDQNLAANLSQLEQERWNLLHQSEGAWGIVKFWFYRRQDRYTEGMVHQARQKWANIGLKVKAVNEEIRNLKQQDQWRRSPYDGGLSALQQSILRLQQSAIHYTEEWIAAEQNQSSTSSTLPTPSVSVSYSNGVYDIAVSGATSGAQVMLYNNSTGQEVSSSTVASNGTSAFNDVASGTYYVVQTLNGIISNRSNVIYVNNTLPTPTIALGQSNGFSQITLTNGVSGAAAYLYNTSGILVASTFVNNSGDAVFNNIAAGSYYVTEYQNGEQSARSNTITVSNALVSPTAYVANSNGISELYVTNVVPGAAVILYSSTGAEVSSTTASSSGDAVFNNLSAGNYYVTQIYNGTQSGSSSMIYVN